MMYICMLINLIFLWVNDFQFLLEMCKLLLKSFYCVELLCLIIIFFLYLFLLFVSVDSIQHEITISLMSNRTCEIDDDSLEIMRLVLNNFSNFGRTWMEMFSFQLSFIDDKWTFFSTKSLNQLDWESYLDNVMLQPLTQISNSISIKHHFFIVGWQKLFALCVVNQKIDQILGSHSLFMWERCSITTSFNSSTSQKNQINSKS